MYTKRTTVVSRSLTAVALAAAISIGSAGIASASGHHSDGVDGARCASARLSSFDYANGGVGGYVTAVSATSITVDQWNGTSATFAVGSSTTVNVGTTAATFTSVVVGDRVRIQVASGSPSTAASITVELAMIFGTVTSVSDSSITITDPQGFTRTIVVSSATTYEVGNSAGSLASVVVGAKIIARGTVDTNGTSLDALSVDVGAAGSNQFVAGVVTGVTGSTVTIQEHGGTSATFTLTSTTLFKDGPLSLTLGDVMVGEQVGIETNSSAATTALRVDIRLAHADGHVTAVSGSTITLTGHQGFATVNVGSSTLYFEGRTASTLAAVLVGTNVIALGTITAGTTTLDALYVEIWTPSVSIGPSHGPVTNAWGNGGDHGNFGGGHGNQGGQGGFGGAHGSHGHFARGAHHRG